MPGGNTTLNRTIVGWKCHRPVSGCEDARALNRTIVGWKSGRYNMTGLVKLPLNRTIVGWKSVHDMIRAGQLKAL